MPTKKNRGTFDSIPNAYGKMERIPPKREKNLKDKVKEIFRSDAEKEQRGWEAQSFMKKTQV